MKDRTETASHILRDATAEFFAREAGPQSLITVTRAVFSSDLAYATIFLSVLPREKEEGVIALAARKRGELKQYLAKRTKLPKLPFLRFEIEKDVWTA